MFHMIRSKLFKGLSRSDVFFILLAVILGLIALYKDSATYATLTAGIIAGLAFHIQHKSLVHARDELIISNEKNQLTNQTRIFREYADRVVIINRYMEKMSGISKCIQDNGEMKFEKLYQDFCIIKRSLMSNSYNPLTPLEEEGFNNDYNLSIDGNGSPIGLSEHIHILQEYESRYILGLYFSSKEDWDKVKMQNNAEQQKNISQLLINKHGLKNYILALIRLANIVEDCQLLPKSNFNVTRYVRGHMSCYEERLLDECWKLYTDRLCNI